MGIVILTLLAAAAILFGVWAAALAKAREIEQAEKRRAAAEVAEKEQAERDLASLRQPGVSLYCLGCGTQFDGPMTDEGCPGCRLTTLVVLADGREMKQDIHPGHSSSGE